MSSVQDSVEMEITSRLIGSHPEILYFDHWSKLYSDGTLVLFKFHFPTTQSRTVRVSRIESISSGTALNLAWWEFKFWGIIPTWIFWTLDFNRATAFLGRDVEGARKRSIVIKTNEGFFRNVGFTCQDPDRFLREIEKLGAKVVREGEGHAHLE
jgi:hypothetical protein